jgi:uncharacterized repeat protein (TIGR02543 family)
VTFNANGGKVAGKSKSAVQVKKGAKIGKLPKPVRSGHTFKGWYTKKSGGVKISKKYKVAKAQTLYARWVKGGANAGFGSTGSGAVSKDQASTNALVGMDWWYTEYFSYYIGSYLYSGWLWYHYYFYADGTFSYLYAGNNIKLGNYKVVGDTIQFSNVKVYEVTGGEIGSFIESYPNSTAKFELTTNSSGSPILKISRLNKSDVTYYDTASTTFQGSKLK